MNNEYFFYPNIELDIEQLKDIVARRLNERLPNYATHHRLVKDEPYLISLKEKYPFLSPIYNIYQNLPNSVSNTHIDKNRYCTLNIPIKNTEDSHTVFYKAEDINNIQYAAENVFNEIKSNTTEIFRFTLTQPIIMNTTIPHGVNNYSDEPRIIMSWSALPDVTYEELREKYSHD